MRFFFPVPILLATAVSAFAHDTDHAPAPSVAEPPSGLPSAGQPGLTEAVTRSIEISMVETDSAMLFEPGELRVNAGETIRFLIRNDGVLAHELVVGTTKDNALHKEAMTKMLEAGHEMDHVDPNAVLLEPGEETEIVWTFTEPGRSEFACLLPGHQELGMAGPILVEAPVHSLH